MAAVSRKRGRTWEHSETVLLLEKWGEDNIQERLKMCSRKKPIWEEISVFLQAAGSEDRDCEACKTRIHTLVNAYRQYKDQCSRSGNGTPTRKAPFFEQLDSILACKPATKPAFVINSAACPAVEQAPALLHQPAAEDQQSDDGEEKQEMNQAEVTCSIVAKEDQSTQKKPLVFTPKAKKRKLSTKDAFGSIQESIGEFLKYQQEADKIFFEQEASREAREQEREKEKRKEDQEFFLRLAEILKK